MSARPISRLVTTALAAGAISVAVSSPAMARPADYPYGRAGVPTAGSGGAAYPYDRAGVPTAVSGGEGHPNIPSGTDVAAPDQQAPFPSAKTTPATRPVPQPAPTWPAHPVALHAPAQSAPSANADFQWDDAGIGAGGAVLIVLTALGGVMAVRRRHVSDPPLAA